MKKLILILILSPAFFKGQPSDTAKVTFEDFNVLMADVRESEKQIKSVKKTVNDMSLNLNKCHKQYKTGLGLTVFGFIVSGIGGALVTDAPEVGVSFFIVGGLSSLIGSITLINSHKFIGRAGLNGISITF